MFIIVLIILIYKKYNLLELKTQQKHMEKIKNKT